MVTLLARVPGRDPVTSWWQLSRPGPMVPRPRDSLRSPIILTLLPGHAILSLQAGVVTRPTSAVKPTNVASKVDSGLSRAGPGRTPVVRQQRSHSPGHRPGQQRSHSPGSRPGQQRSQSAGPSRKNSLQNRQVASLKPSQSATPELPRKHPAVTQLSLADDEASDTENESRYDMRRVNC